MGYLMCLKSTKFDQTKNQNKKIKENEKSGIFLKNRAEKITGMDFLFGKIDGKLMEKKF